MLILELLFVLVAIFGIAWMGGTFINGNITVISAAVSGYFFVPNYPTIVAAINFDRTGTTHIGKYVLNHSFMMPGMVATFSAVACGLLLIQLYQ